MEYLCLHEKNICEEEKDVVAKPGLELTHGAVPFLRIFCCCWGGETKHLPNYSKNAGL